MIKYKEQIPDSDTGRTALSRQSLLQMGEAHYSPEASPRGDESESANGTGG